MAYHTIVHAKHTHAQHTKHTHTGYHWLENVVQGTSKFVTLHCMNLIILVLYDLALADNHADRHAK